MRSVFGCGVIHAWCVWVRGGPLETMSSWAVTFCIEFSSALSCDPPLPVVVLVVVAAAASGSGGGGAPLVEFRGEVS